MVNYTVTKVAGSFIQGNPVYSDEQGVYYILSTSTASVVGYISSTDGKSIVIPDNVNDGSTYTVTTILDSAFKNSKITGVTFSENLQSIGANAFYPADNLVDIVWGASNPVIGANAFNSYFKFSYKNASFAPSIESISISPSIRSQYGLNRTIFSVIGLPAELSFSRVTGKISSNGKVPVTGGTYTLNVTASSSIYGKVSTTVSITMKVVSELTPAQIQALTKEQIQAFTTVEIQTLTKEQIQAFTIEQIPAFTRQQIQAFN
uniref:Uncharacterized protein n=1 Tax=viral metagenome TaxID=1070528 RepID=A0A6C0KJC8_9ZZZZ